MNSLFGGRIDDAVAAADEGRVIYRSDAHHATSFLYGNHDPGVCALALQALSVSLYVFTRDLASFYGLALIFGFSYGAVMPLYAILVREYFGARIMGTMFGAVNMASTLGMAMGPWAGGWLYDAYASYFWLYIGSFGIGLGAVAIAFTFRPPREVSVGLPSPSVPQSA
jgi:MFS family permease